jgi:hypothetical protein
MYFATNNIGSYHCSCCSYYLVSQLNYSDIHHIGEEKNNCICLSETNYDSCCFSTFFSGNNKDIWYGWCCSHISWCSVKILPNICLNHLLWFRIISDNKVESNKLFISDSIYFIFPQWNCKHVFIWCRHSNVKSISVVLHTVLTSSAQ